MKLILSQQMKNIDKKAAEHIGIPSIVLMENAALTVVNECKEYLKTQTNKNVIVFCGKGNNGGDGLAIARHLHLSGINTTVVFIGDEMQVSQDCKINLNIIYNLNISIIKIKSDNDLNSISINSYSLIIDAILGTGLNYDLSGIYKASVEVINSSSSYVISVDCPSGISADTGKIQAVAVNANKTVTFFLPKPGLILYPGCEYAGELKVTNIGIPQILSETEDIRYNILTTKDAKKLLPKRTNNSHKGSFGKIFLFAGSKQMPGACAISATALYKTGCGLVNACVTEYVASIIHNTIPEAITTILSDNQGFLCEESYREILLKDINATAIVIGCGLGQNINVRKFVYKVIEYSKVSIVIDADALNAISHNVCILEKLKTTAILTPHIGEMSRLTGLSIKQIKENPIKVAIEFSKKYNIILVLKDYRSIIVNPSGKVYINNTGCNAMSKAGSGDSLAGCIGGFLAQGLKPYDAAVLGAYINGLAGEYAAKQYGNYGVLARDTATSIPLVIENILK